MSFTPTTSGCPPESLRPGYRVILKVLEVRRCQVDAGALGWLRVTGTAPEVVPAGSTIVLEGLIHVIGAQNEK